MRNTVLKNTATGKHDTRQFLEARTRYRILEFVNRHGPVSRQDIAWKCGIRPATVISFIEKLIKDGFISENGPGKSSGGRRPILLEFNPAARLAVGVFIGEEGIRTALVDLRGKIVATEKKDGLEYRSRAGFLSAVATTVSRLSDGCGIDRKKIIGVGMAVPGLVERERGISFLYTLHEWWRDIPFKGAMEKKLGLPMVVENDTRVMTMAEKWFGAAAAADNFIYLDVAEGIAVGIFLSGRIYTGIGGSAGEAGHITIDRNGPLCRCGNRGCLEAVASTTSVEKRMAKLTGRRKSFRGIVDSAESGNRAATRVLNEMGKSLGIGLAGMVNLLNPGLIVLGGTAAYAGKLVLSPMKNEMKKRGLDRPVSETEIVTSRLGEHGGELGAASLILQKFYETY